ncbi:Multidrug resistance-associated protein 9 [Chamberlinius hualienensis]
MEEKYQPNKSWMEKYQVSMKMCLPFRTTKDPDESKLPDEKIGCFSFVSMNWFSREMWRASRKGLETNQIGQIRQRNGVAANSARLQYMLDEEMMQKGVEKASLLRTVLRFNRTRLILAAVVMIMMVTFHYVGQTWVLLKLLEYLGESNQPMWNGIVWAIAVAIGQLFRHILFSAFYIIGAYSGIKLCGAIQGVIYDKILNSKFAGDIQLAEIINYCTSDLERMFQLMQTSVLAVAAPTCWIFNVVYCYNLMGVWSLLGNLIILLYYPFMMLVAKTTGKIRAKASRITDKRIGLMSQFLTNIKFIKSMSWENIVFDTVNDVRDDEIKVLRNATFLQSISWSTAPIVGVLAPMMTIIGHLLTGGTLNSAQVFTLIAAYGALSFPLNTLPIAVKAISEGVISCRRIQKLLISKNNTRHQTPVSRADDSRPIVFHNTSVGWNDSNEDQPIENHLEVNREEKSRKSKSNLHSSKSDLINNNSKNSLDGIVNMGASISTQDLSNPSLVLHDINLSIEKGQLIGICGQVGSGKSTLLSTITGNTNIVNGDVNVTGSVALVTQQAWIFSGTVMENIVFGLPFDSKWYQHVVHSCCLETDFKLMDKGDQTEIGERGTNLSGGQKQRISLARAMYSNRDIYLLDDSLSAVDAKVARHIFRNCFQKDLKNKTVLLVTHAIHFLENCDYIVVMKDGRIVEQGTHESLIATGEEYPEMIRTTDEQRNKLRDQLEVEKKKSLKRLESAVNEPAEINEKTSNEEVDTKISISFKTLLYYCKSCGGYCISFIMLSTIVIFNLILVFNNLWLKIWLSDQLNFDNSTNQTTHDTITEYQPGFDIYCSVYGASLIGIIVMGLFKSLAVGKTMLRGAAELHRSMLLKVVRSPMAFFDITPLGRIINRFSRDMDELDTYIPYFSEFVVQIFIITFFQLVLICVLYPWFSLAIIVITVIYFLFDKLLISGIKETKRMDNLLKPQVLSQISSTVQGLEVIRCYKKEKLLAEKFKDHVEKHLAAYLLYQLSSKWFAFRADLIGWLAVTGMAFMTIFSKDTQSATDGGLAMTQILVTCNTLGVVMRWKSELQAKLISIERICEYVKKLKEEAPAIVKENRPNNEWPFDGSIEFKDVYLKYREETPLVLQGLSVNIKGGEKIGIIGRTGAGKSSIIGALLRITEVHSGTIAIDNIDISKIGLEDLRSKIAVIPQEPVLFDGSVRWNLDPNNKYTDEEIWTALEKSHLKSKVTKFSNGLETVFSAEGGMFSVGEKQLFCLARALLKNSKILLLDEATANVDFETDKLIQNSIRSSFSNCTVLTIAHRLNTIVDYDKIMTMEAGKVIEFDSPVNLINTESRFRSMLHSQ